MTYYIAPGFLMSRIVNPVVIRFGLSPTLTVVGRRSGVERTIPFGGPIEVDGQRYLVSGRGETDWARNLRAAGRGRIKMHGMVEPFRAVELHGQERARILRAYREKLGGAVRHYFDVIPSAAAHPVFRMEPA